MAPTPATANEQAQVNKPTPSIAPPIFVDYMDDGLES
jgi:hypothetical protein